jgi:hypothetical protein
MSVQPGQYNISLQRRADFDLQLQFKGDALIWNAVANRWEPTDSLTLLEARVTALENP